MMINDGPQFFSEGGSGQGVMDAGSGPPETAMVENVLPRDLAAATTRQTLDAVESVNRVVQYLVVMYVVSVASLLYSMGRGAPVCGAGEECLRPWLGKDMDFFVMTSVSSTRPTNVTFAKCGAPTRERFDADLRVFVPPEVRTDALPMTAYFFARPAVADGCCVEEETPAAGKSSSSSSSLRQPCSVQSTSVELGRVSLIEIRATRPRQAPRSLLDEVPRQTLAEKEKDVDTTAPAAGDFRPHWRFGRTPLVVRVLDVEGLERRVARDGLPTLGVDDVKTTRGDFSSFFFQPIAYLDETVALASHALPVSGNASKKEKPLLRIQYRPSGPLVAGLRRVAVPQLLRVASLVLSPDDVDDLRWHLGDSRVFRYLATQVVQFLHVNLAWYAFKEEVSFYVGRSSFKGVAPSAVLWGFFRTLVVFLYLRDAGAGVLAQVGVFSNLLCEFTKVTRVLRVTFPPKQKGSFPFFARLFFFFGDKDDKDDDEDKDKDDEDKDGRLSLEERRRRRQPEEEDPTRDYDTRASLHLGVGLGPGLVGFAVYSLAFDVHKSWYSWIVNSLADLSYFVGFLTMVPQIYVNYRLQSVAHLPVKAFGYKIFNTFVDDVFSWVVDMPLKHRLMTLRDDLVFLVFIFQYFKYRVDKSRVNEFGFVYAAEDTNDDHRPKAGPAADKKVLLPGGGGGGGAAREEEDDDETTPETPSSEPQSEGTLLRTTGTGGAPLD
mmetsp:Transcript_34184/g.109764  ORF Transcript_34184/g.109764 Transcript_34184/m.109764 type:complete len:717 (-) Transcript_34184:1323-3473(-)